MADDRFKVGYPVDFRSGGDTTQQAFGKHIQEIVKIYGDLNALNAESLSSSEFTKKLEEHIKDSDPHPNLIINLDTTTGNLDGGRITGDIAAKLVKGKLTGATISAANVDSLTTFVEGLIPKQTNTGIKYISLAQNGYADFYNGLQIRWGVSENTDVSVTFVRPFSSQCFMVVASLYLEDMSNWGNTEYDTSGVISWDKNGFNGYFLQHHMAHRRCSYIAIGA